METILEIGRQLADGAGLDQLLDRIVVAALGLTETEAAGIFLVDEQGQNLRLVASTLYKDRSTEILVPVDCSIAGAAFTGGRAVMVSNVSDDPRYYSRTQTAANFAIRSLLAVPLQFKECKFGVLEVENKLADQPFDEQDVDLLTLLASQAAIAIENVHRYQAGRLESSETARAEIESLTQRLQQETVERERALGDLKSFSRTVAHEIKGLLGTLLGYAELIARDAEPAGAPTLSRWAEESIVAIFKVGKIVDALSLLTRVRLQEVPVSRLEMEKVVEGAERRLKKQIDSLQAEIKSPACWPVAMGYAPWVEEVWVNYLSNAIQAGGKPPQSELGAQPSLNPQTGAEEVRFWIRDNGCGLTLDEQVKLFVEFERLGQTRSPRRGLGLVVVKRIVEKLGGSVGVQSAQGQGSEFFFTLPGSG